MGITGRRDAILMWWSSEFPKVGATGAELCGLAHVIFDALGYRACIILIDLAIRDATCMNAFFVLHSAPLQVPQGALTVLASTVDSGDDQNNTTLEAVSWSRHLLTSAISYVSCLYVRQGCDVQ